MALCRSGKSRKIPGLVQPYTPREDLDWDLLTLESDILLRFTDPQVAREFTVYKHRDLIPTFMMAAFVLGGNGFVWWTRLAWIPWIFLPVCLVPAFGNLICAALDLWAFLESGSVEGNTKLRDRLGQVRWGLCLVCVILLLVEVEMPAAWSTYDEHCRHSPDWFAELGARTSPATIYSDKEISYYCSRSPSVFVAMMGSFSWTAFPFLTVLLVPVYLLGFLLRWVAELLYPRQAPLPATDRGLQILLEVFMMLVFLILHAIRSRTAMTQFRQEIALRRATNLAMKREEEVDRLLCSMLPMSALERLSTNEDVADSTEDATVLFSDMKGFTAWSSRRTAREVVAMLNVLCLEIDVVAEDIGVIKIKTIGDAYWAVAGLPEEVLDHAERICNFGNAMLDIVSTQNKKHPEWDGVSLRIGVHSGPLDGGILGTQQLSYEVFGVTSNIAAKVEQAGTPGFVVVTETTLAYLSVSPQRCGRVVGAITEEEDGSINISSRVLDQVAVTAEVSPDPKEQPQSPLGHSDGVFGVSPAIATHRLYCIPRTRDVVRALASSGATNQEVASASASTPRSEPRSLSHQEAAKKRADFLAQRTRRRKGVEDKDSSEPVSSETLEDIIAKYSQRKNQCWVRAFADPKVEAQFISHLAQQQSQLRIGGRVGLLVLLTILVLSVVIPQGTFSVASMVLFPIAAVGGLVDLAVVCLVRPGGGNVLAIQWMQTALQLVVIILVLLAAGLMPPGSSYLTNDVAYLFIILVPIWGKSNSGFVSSFGMFVILLLVVIPLLTWLLWDVVALTLDIAFAVCLTSMLLPFLVVTERVHRLQFLQFHTAEFFQKKQEERTWEQEALLSAMVPAHTVKELLTWMQAGMDPAKTLTENLPTTATGFLQIEHINKKKVRTAPSGSASPLSRDGGSPVDFAMARGMSSQMVSKFWLQSVHEEVDEVLQQFKSVIKIKTIGESVMLAGPFTPEYDLTTACDEMLAAICLVKRVAPLRAGLHCGELVGAVLGCSRLCFDIFGDTVNTCSRVMTSGRPGEDVSLSEEFYSSLPTTRPAQQAQRRVSYLEVPIDVGKDKNPLQPPEEGYESCASAAGRKSWLTEGMVFTDEPISVPAKGKGMISVRKLVKMEGQ